MKNRLGKNKKIIVAIGSIAIVLCGVISLSIYRTKEFKQLDNSKKMAFFIKDDDNSDYTKVNNIPSNGYSLNSSKSVCNNGATPSWNNGTLTLKNLREKNTSCYLYFDKTSGLTSSDIINTLNATTQTDSVPNFASAATTNEGVFKTSDGMYGGDTYYFRGAVDNNHVMFADLCWKIIRINGDGSIRMIYNGVPENGVCKQVSDATSIAISNQTYNASRDKSYYVGWMYEVDKQRPTNNLIATPNNIKTQTDDWYENNITKKGLDGKITTGKFCNDRSLASGSSWSASGSTFYYSGHDRSGAKDTSYVKPVTTCPNDDVYEMKAGAIAMDEVIMAGGKYGTANSSYYLYNNQNYWTMSPSATNGARVFSVNSEGKISRDYTNNTGIGIRPVINLLPSTLFKLGTNGASSSPYEVI